MMKSSFLIILCSLMLKKLTIAMFSGLKFEEQVNLLSCKAISQKILENDKKMIIQEFSEKKQNNRTIMFEKSYWHLINYCVNNLNEEVLKEAYHYIGNKANLQGVIDKYLPDTTQIIRDIDNFTLSEDEENIRRLFTINEEEIITESQPNRYNVDFIKMPPNYMWFQFNNNFMLYLSLAILTTMFYIAYKHLAEETKKPKKKVKKN